MKTNICITSRRSKCVTYLSTNILSTKENNLEQEYLLVDKPYYVDRIAFKVDNSEQWLIDTD